MALQRLSRCVGTLGPGCGALPHRGRLCLAVEVPQAQAGDTGLPGLCLRLQGQEEPQTVCGCVPPAVAGDAAMLSTVQGGSGVQAPALRNLLRPARGARLALPWGQEAVLGLLRWLRGLPRVPGGREWLCLSFPDAELLERAGEFPKHFVVRGFPSCSPEREEVSMETAKGRAAGSGPAPFLPWWRGGRGWLGDRGTHLGMNWGSGGWP